mmetsp:Transcript_14667/g.13171  ORF Transcript_14667/g.13171 Transcript_14667/m.13171 type:complete len:461 (-) Transcript_14667:84-1466(-)
MFNRLTPRASTVQYRTLKPSLLQYHRYQFANSAASKSSSFVYGAIGLLSLSFVTQCMYISYAYFDYKSSNLPFNPFALLRPIIFKMDPEKSHRYAVRAAGQLPKSIRNAFGLVYKNGIDQSKLETNLETTVWDLKFPNPIGLAAGFDKHGECIDGMFDLGFGFVEIGSITPKSQVGNDKPRVWRLIKDEAVLNRYGFNSDGHEAVKQRLKKRLSNMSRSSYGKLGINLGKNKYVKQADAVNDYIKGIENFTEYADYLVINISSPNTPGLRDLQKREIIHNLLSKVKITRDNTHNEIFKKSPMGDCVKCKPPPPPLLVKIAPDLNDSEIEDIAFVVKDVGIDGIIVSNTTISRENLKTDESITSEYGGLSGKPVFQKSNEVLRKMYKATDGKVPLIGVGGISSVEDAYEKIKCGASLVQLYTGMIYNGPTLIHHMIDNLDKLAKDDGYNHVTEARGASVKL